VNLLNIENLTVTFSSVEASIKAVDDVSFGIGNSEVVGLVGESGCGKTVTALSILRLLPCPPAEIKAKGIFWKGRNLLKASIEEMHSIRGNEISIIFQEPLSSFNPVQKVGKQIQEILEVHNKKIENGEAYEKVIQMLSHVGIQNPEWAFESYPHELSGGMRQRAMIAMALMNGPELLIADEPTTALDVTIQAQILDLLEKLQKERHLSILMITHNLGIVARIANRVVVMYAGKVVEDSQVKPLFKEPLHPYTQGLLKSIPNPEKKQRLYAIPGMIPDPANLPSGCTFHPRCPYVMDICKREFPPLNKVDDSRAVACWLY